MPATWWCEKNNIINIKDSTEIIFQMVNIIKIINK
jgi:hypothetical protein